MWRDGLFIKLKVKVDQPIWRALYNFYKISNGKIKLNNEISGEFEIKEGVKQGEILSAYLFNFFMNIMLKENDENKFGATIGDSQVGLLSYCDDLVILSPLMSHINLILKNCEVYAEKWKLVFNTKKCNWYIHGKGAIRNLKFVLNRKKLGKVDGQIHLGLPIGNRKNF